ncbi:hypothetical protein [Candidatus Tisiphia endosymbiont of Thecophora atra]|uniref:hypothetical protein n=1 Tax=Candidatus Tisiphia endosymbiont of Thecophora atra TaxID=3066258 RepID=UPI00312CB303
MMNPPYNENLNYPDIKNNNFNLNNYTTNDSKSIQLTTTDNALQFCVSSKTDNTLQPSLTSNSNATLRFTDEQDDRAILGDNNEGSQE